jgi:hypothetical protein
MIGSKIKVFRCLVSGKLRSVLSGPFLEALRLFSRYPGNGVGDDSCPSIPNCFERLSDRCGYVGRSSRADHPLNSNFSWHIKLQFSLKPLRRRMCIKAASSAFCLTGSRTRLSSMLYTRPGSACRRMCVCSWSLCAPTSRVIRCKKTPACAL